MSGCQSKIDIDNHHAARGRRCDIRLDAAAAPGSVTYCYFLQSVRKKFDRVVWEAPPTWDADDAASLAIDVKVIPARDPLAHGALDAPVAYYRLPGPAGHKSRYEDPAIEKLAALAKDAKHKDATYVFTNVDMFADAKRFKKAMKASAVVSRGVGTRDARRSRASKARAPTGRGRSR